LINGWVGDDTISGKLLWRFVRTDRVPYESYKNETDRIKYFQRNRPDRVPRTEGVPQGGVLSGMLANLYLYEFDDWVVNDLAGSGQDIKYIRYADDVRRRKAAREETQRRGSVREKRYKAPTLSRPGNRLGSVAWWERSKFCNPQQTTEGQARLDTARAKLPKDQFRAVIA
jgi:hypothetical protein